MTKKDIYSADAERMYVVEQHNLERIATELNLNFKTVLAWKQEGNWEEKRLEYIKGRQMFHEELYYFARKLMHSIEDDIDNNRKTENGKLYTFTRMLPLITKIKEYEDIATKKEEKDKDKTTLSSEDVKEIEDLLGIRRNKKPLIEKNEAEKESKE